MQVNVVARLCTAEAVFSAWAQIRAAEIMRSYKRGFRVIRVVLVLWRTYAQGGEQRRVRRKGLNQLCAVLVRECVRRRLGDSLRAWCVLEAGVGEVFADMYVRAGKKERLRSALGLFKRERCV